MSSPVKVQIFGQSYSLHGDLEPAYLQTLASFVDEKMTAIADATATIDTHKVAVLAALPCVLIDFAWFRAHEVLVGNPLPKRLWEF